MRLLTRKRAKARGLTRYFDGSTCKHGHTGYRDTANATCVECSRGWKRRNKERVLQYARDYHKAHQKERLAYAKRYAESRRGKAIRKSWNKQFYETNKERRHEECRIWRLTFPEKQKAANAKWYANNRDYIRKQNAAKWHIRKHDEQYKLKHYLRARTSRLIKRGQKPGSFVSDLGCTIGELKTFIEKQFTSGMTWKNWGRRWELDHVVPLHTFQLTDRQQFLEAANFNNLQPLSIAAHREKTAKEISERRKN